MQQPQAGTFHHWPAGWRHTDLEPYLQRVEQLLPTTATPSKDGRRYLDDTGGQVLREALSMANYSLLEDSTQPVAASMGVPRVTAKDGIRVSSASAFLLPALSKLELITEATVKEIVFTGDKADRLHVHIAGKLHTVHLAPAGMVVLAAGAYNTPRLLMQSGVGPVGRIVNEKVGDGLSDKTITWRTFHVRNKGVAAFHFDPPSHKAIEHYILNQSGPLAQFGPTLAAFYQHPHTSHAFDVEMFVNPAQREDEVHVNFVLMRPSCSSASLSLDQHQVQQHGSMYMACPRDREVMQGAVDMVTEQMAKIGGSVVAAAGSWPHTSAMNHFAGSCALGACVDPSTLLVRGTSNVAVADASLLPNQVWGHPALTLTAIALKAAEVLSGNLGAQEMMV